MVPGPTLPSAGNSVDSNIFQSGSVYSTVVQNLITYPMTYEEIVLISDGLDSLLAAKVIQDQNIHFEGHIHAIRKKVKAAVKLSNACLDNEIYMVQKSPVKPLVTEKMSKGWLLA